ncbi:MAG: NnrU family protein [Betaproteobacteria bacterium]
MLLMVLGLVVFLGTHSLRLRGNALRNGLITRFGKKGFKGLYAVLSLAGFAAVVVGFGLARDTPVLLWMPPAGLRHLAFLLMALALVLLAAAYVPNNGIRARLHHPMVLSVKVWALAHLLVNGTLAHVVLFGSFLIWSVLLFSASRRHDRQQEVVYPPGTRKATALTVVLGVLVCVVFIAWLHGLLIGIRLVA